jgi:uncharacterized protein (TIGR00290 family)
MKPQVLLSWSSGKDSAWALHVLRRQAEWEIVGLVTTFNEAFDRVAMHAVRRELVEAQATAAGVQLWPVPLPWPCTNDEYAARMLALLRRALSVGISHMAFGDLFLEDVRAYREKLLAGTGITPLFPVWCAPADTAGLAREMIAAGLEAILTCVDPRKLAPAFAGRRFDERLLSDLPPGVDPCGELGEFHTFCHRGPMFASPVPIRTGPVLERDGFCFADVLPDDALLRTPA